MTFDGRHRAARYEHKIYRIESDQPLFNAITVPWAPWLQKRPEIRARVIAADGQIHQLDPKTLTASSPSVMPGGVVFGDWQLLQAPLPALHKGAIVEIETITEDQATALSSGQAGAIELLDTGPSLETRIRLDAPSDLALRWRPIGEIDAEPAESEQRGRRIVELRVGRVDSLGLLQGRVPDRPRIEFSTAPSWSAVASEYAAIVEKQIGPVPGDWPAAAESPQATIAALLALVHQRVRYTSVALGAASIVPRPPAETLSRRYGDCKDKSTLLAALLPERGIDAQVALLRAVEADIDPELPGFGLFNHAIVYVPGLSPIWIDPTDEYARSGELPAGDQDRWALIATAGTTQLVRTPGSDSMENRIEVTRRIELSERGEGTKTETRRSSGEFERQARRLSAQSSAEQIVERLNSRSGLQDSRKPVHRVLAITPSQDLSQPFEQSIEAASPDFQTPGNRSVSAAFAGAGEVLNIFSLQLGVQPEKDDGEAPQAKPVRLAFPYSASSELRVVPPPGFQLRRLPEALQADLGPAIFSEEVRVEDDGSVVMKARFDSRQREFDPEQAEKLRSEVARLRKRGEVKIEFDNLADLHLNAGRVRAAIDACREVLAEHPDDAGHRRRLVQAYLAAGAGVEAVSEARRLVEDSPNAVAYWTLGHALISDPIGRRESPGMDLAGAIDAFRRSSQLDDEFGSADLGLVRTLSLNEQGVPYEPSRLDEALAFTAELVEQSKSAGAMSSHANLLSKMGRHQEVIDLLADLEFRDAYMPVYLIEALAVVQGVDAAIDRASQSGANCSSQLRNAAGRLSRTRHYKESAALFAAAADEPTNGGNSTADTMYAELYNRTVRHEELELDPRDPRSVVKRWLIALHAAEDWRQAIAPLVSRYGKTQLLSDLAGRQFEEWVDGAVYEQAPEFDDRARRADEVLALANYQVDGDDAQGYRIRATWPNTYGRYGRQEVDYFVVREADEYRILDAGEGRLGDLAAAVLDRLDNGNFEGARRLLDWAAEVKAVQWPEFNFVWTAGPAKSPELARMAAAALMANNPARAQRAIEILMADQANTVAFDKGLARASHLALAHAASGDWDQSLHWMRQQLALDPTQPAVVNRLAHGLAARGRLDEALAVYDERIGKDGAQDDSLLETRIQRAIMALDLENLAEMIGRLEARGVPAVNLWNGAAWASVVKGSADQGAREAADKAVRLSSGRSYAVLNTQAAVYALLGEADAARKTLLQSIVMGRRRALDGADWFVAGLVAESYGMLDSARHAYQKAADDSVPAQAAEIPSVLARRALQRLK